MSHFAYLAYLVIAVGAIVAEGARMGSLDRRFPRMGSRSNEVGLQGPSAVRLGDLCPYSSRRASGNLTVRPANNLRRA